MNAELFDYVLTLGDDSLILGHRLSQWCGHAPILEEELALGNIALDCLGHALHLLNFASQVENQGRSADTLVYSRVETEFRNCALVEQPNYDFGYTIARQFFYSAFAYLHYEALKKSSNEHLAAIAAKAHKEVTYHLRHAREWMVRLGDGTAESHERISAAVNDLWMFTGELFYVSTGEQSLLKKNIVPNRETFRDPWNKLISETLIEATIPKPDADIFMYQGAREGRHTEHLGHLLAELQIVSRTFPTATW